MIYTLGLCLFFITSPVIAMETLHEEDFQLTPRICTFSPQLFFTPFTPPSPEAFLEETLNTSLQEQLELQESEKNTRLAPIMLRTIASKIPEDDTLVLCNVVHCNQELPFSELIIHKIQAHALKINLHSYKCTICSDQEIYRDYGTIRYHMNTAHSNYFYHCLCKKFSTEDRYKFTKHLKQGCVALSQQATTQTMVTPQTKESEEKLDWGEDLLSTWLGTPALPIKVKGSHFAPYLHPKSNAVALHTRSHYTKPCRKR